MTKIIDIANYQPRSTDVFFFDNNIWMYLFCPIAGYQKHKQQKYSDFFSKINIAKACIWINSLVLSEFCNAWLKIEYENWRRKPENVMKSKYKLDFIPSDTYKKSVSQIKLTLTQILNNTERCSDEFNSIDLENVYKELDNCDFNDSYYLELARTKNWKIVTDDADFFNYSNNVEVKLQI